MNSAPQIPELYATQQKIIATLGSTVESWHKFWDAYNPLQPHDSIEARYAAGRAAKAAAGWV